VDTLSWSPTLFGVAFGDGTYPKTNGWIALNGIDLVGHELAHGVALASVGAVIGDLADAVDEGNSDILGKMLQAWTDGGGNAPTIPDFDPNDATRWQVGLGELSGGQVLRYLDRPSDDNISGDEWYDGLQDLAPWYTAGPIRRFFVLLAQGVSTDPSSRRYSAYLKGGMPGIGNDRAARIWYRALTEQLIAAADFDDARAATVIAAQELYGQGSTEEQAVIKAWAAVNVGSAPGEGPRVRVTLPVTNGPDSFLAKNAYPPGILSRVQFFPTRAHVAIRASVANTSDERIQVSFGKPGESQETGHVNADGSWTTPSFTYGDLRTMSVASAADPLQYAKAQVLIVELDADTDGQADALDLGLVAMSWGVKNLPTPTASVIGWTPISDWDLVFFDEAFANAWPAAHAQ
jgi:hypothetical protein